MLKFNLLPKFSTLVDHPSTATAKEMLANQRYKIQIVACNRVDLFILKFTFFFLLEWIRDHQHMQKNDLEWIAI